MSYDGEAVLIDDHAAEFDWPARMLIDTILWQVETARIFGREMPIPRMTAWFGDGAYSYSGILHLPAPFPALIERLRERAEALSGALFNAALANLYRNGRDSVGWHSDHEAALGNRPTIASLSLGEERRFQFRQAGYSHDTVLLTEQVKRLDRLLGQADDPGRRKFAHQCRR